MGRSTGIRPKSESQSDATSASAPHSLARASVSPASGADLASLTSYGALGLHATASTASTIQTIGKTADRATTRGQMLMTGERTSAGTRRGRAADKIATKAVAIAESKGLTMLSAVANSRLVTLASKAAIPYLIAKTAWDAGRGYQKDGLTGAAIGAGDSLTFGRVSAAIEGYKQAGVAGAGDALTFNIVSFAAKQASKLRDAAASLGSKAPANAKTAPAEPVHMSRDNAVLAKMYADSHAMDWSRASPAAEPVSAPGDKSGGPRGFANAAVQYAAQEARGVQKYSDWAKSGTGSAGSDAKKKKGD